MVELMGNPQYITDVETTPFVFPYELVPGSGGANLKRLPAELIIKFHPGFESPVNKISIPNKDTNVKEYKVELIKLDDSKPEIYTSNNASQPIIIDSTDRIKTIIFTIISTTDNAYPKNVEISIQSCSPQPTVTTHGTTMTKVSQIFTTFRDEACDTEMGMRARKIPSDNIFVSSNKKDKDYIRIGSSQYWTPSPNDKTPYVIIKFNCNYLILYYNNIF